MVSSVVATFMKDSDIHPPWSFVNPLFFNYRFLRNPTNQLNAHLNETLAI